MLDDKNEKNKKQINSSFCVFPLCHIYTAHDVDRERLNI